MQTLREQLWAASHWDRLVTNLKAGAAFIKKIDQGSGSADD
jgi:hypothetical protein